MSKYCPLVKKKVTYQFCEDCTDCHYERNRSSIVESRKEFISPGRSQNNDNTPCFGKDPPPEKDYI